VSPRLAGRAKHELEERLRGMVAELQRRDADVGGLQQDLASARMQLEDVQGALRAAEERYDKQVGAGIGCRCGVKLMTLLWCPPPIQLQTLDGLERELSAERASRSVLNGELEEMKAVLQSAAVARSELERFCQQFRHDVEKTALERRGLRPATDAAVTG
jgi:DNA repair exonuclease SbcCD ATPase subunit